MKILTGFGKSGQYVQFGITEYNWTLPNEPVNIDRVICCQSPSCSCDRTFHGIRSGQKTTKAIVVEVPDHEFVAYCEQIYQEAMDSYRKAGIKQSAGSKNALRKKSCFIALSQHVADLAVGTIVTIKKNAVEEVYEITAEFDTERSSECRQQLSPGRRTETRRLTLTT